MTGFTVVTFLYVTHVELDWPSRVHDLDSDYMD